MQKYLIVLLIFISGPALASAKEFTFSVVPQQSASKTAKLWGPIITHLEEKTGHHFKLLINKNIPGFERELLSGQPDFAYMNPYHYVVFHEKHGYVPLVRAKDREIKGIIVVNKASPMQALADLQGKIIAFPAPAAFAATLLPQGILKQERITTIAEYVGSHDAVYLNVAKGVYAAGGGILRTLNSMSADVRNNLRILWTSPGYTPHPIAAHPRVPKEVMQAVQSSLMALDASGQGRSILSPLKIKGWVKASNSDWDSIRSVRLSTPQ